jgi:hypothetical protein
MAEAVRPHRLHAQQRGLESPAAELMLSHQGRPRKRLEVVPSTLDVGQGRQPIERRRLADPVAGRAARRECCVEASARLVEMPPMPSAAWITRYALSVSAGGEKAGVSPWPSSNTSAGSATPFSR